MHHAHRVRVGDSLAGVSEMPHQAELIRLGLCRPVSERAPPDQTHGVVGPTIFANANVVERHDTGMVEPRRDPRLLREPLAGSGHGVRAELLEGDHPVQPSVDRGADLAHPAAPQQSASLVALALGDAERVRFGRVTRGKQPGLVLGQRRRRPPVLAGQVGRVDRGAPECALVGLVVHPTAAYEYFHPAGDPAAVLRSARGSPQFILPVRPVAWHTPPAMHAFARFLLPDGSYHELVPGDLIGRHSSAALQLDDAPRLGGARLSQPARRRPAAARPARPDAGRWRHEDRSDPHGRAADRARARPGARRRRGRAPRGHAGPAGRSLGAADAGLGDVIAAAPGAGAARALPGRCRGPHLERRGELAPAAQG